jgi:hypothetical protein
LKGKLKSGCAFGPSPPKKSRDAAEADPLIAVAGSAGVNLSNSQKSLDRGLLEDYGRIWMSICAAILRRRRALRLLMSDWINFCDDPGSIDAFWFLMTREIRRAVQRSFVSEQFVITSAESVFYSTKCD